MSSSFFPEDYQPPKSKSESYVTLQDGENIVRILSQPIAGYEDWTIEKKPVRFHPKNKPEKPLIEGKDIKFFIAMIVWNYSEEKIQILCLTQVSVRKAIENLIADKHWGDAFFYDIKITKKGVSKETKYTVTPLPMSPVSARIIDEFNLNPCRLEALYEGGDPFSGQWEKTTPGIFSKEDIKKTKIVNLIETPIIGKFSVIGDKVTLDEANELACHLDCCDPAYKESVWNSLQKNGIVSLMDLTREMYERVKKAAIKKSEEYKNQDLPF